MVSPNGSDSRVEGIDALRGLALLGMVVVHFLDYARDGGIASAQIGWAKEVFAVDKFYPLFAFLFGVSFAIQHQRWGERPGFAPMFLRRLAWLAAFAAVLIAVTGYHVLETYAIWGVALVAIRSWPRRAVLLLVLACMWAPATRHFAIAKAEQRQGVTLAQSNERMAAEARVWRDYNQEESRLQKEGTALQRARHRLKHNFGIFLTLPGLIYGSNAFLMFLLGLLAYRQGALQDPRRYRDLLVLVIVIGAAATLFSGGVVELPRLKLESFRTQVAYGTLLYNVYNEQFLGLAYASALLLGLASWPRLWRLGHLLALPGRMSLTTYVAQIVVLQLLFLPYTVGIEPTRIAALAGALALFALQIAASGWWLRRYDHGPLEWLWRCGTRAKWEPLRRVREAEEPGQAEGAA